MSNHGKAAAGGEGRWWRLRNWPLSTKLVVVLIVPTTSMLAFAGVRLQAQLQDVALFDQVAQELTLNRQVADTTDALQSERDAMVSYMAGGRVGNADDEVHRSQQVDAAVRRLVDTARSTTGLPDGVSAALDTAMAELDDLDALRATALNTRYPDTATLTRYTTILDALAQVGRSTADSIGNPTLVPLAAANQALATAKEQRAEQTAIVLDAARSGHFRSAQTDDLLAAQSREAAALNEFAQTAGPDLRQYFQSTVSGPDPDGSNRLMHLALLQHANNQPIAVGVDDVLRTGEATSALIDKVQARTVEQLRAQVADLADAAQQGVTRDSVLVGAILAVALGLMVLVARSLLRPLRTLEDSALKIAGQQLPAEVERILSSPVPQDAALNTVEPVPVHTKEEVGRLARAFDAVHGEAVRLATQQAMLRDNVNAMFVNLSRRSQMLVQRQLRLLDHLEQDEQDPDQLADLFELDHLATRMRRNSENLLVLSGTKLGRRLDQPVPVSDVIGAAVSEVEQYARVQAAPTPELSVQGRAVNDLIHLVAELLDNATAFSDPVTKVTVRTILTRRGELAIEIHDRGLGMSDHEILAANRRIADPPVVDVEVSRRMGLYVVARLAKRHDITVRLRSNEDIEGGTTALIVVPSAQLTDVQAAALDTADTLRRRKLAWREGNQGAAVAKDRGDTKERPTPKTHLALPAPQPPPPDDDASTERYPIYEEVLSRWFRSVDDEEKADGVVVPEAAPVREHWHSAADDGWRMVGKLTEIEPEALTSQGLPKRVPRAQLMPGSIPSARSRPSSAGELIVPEAVRDRLGSFQRGVSAGRQPAPAVTAPSPVSTGHQDE